MKQYEIYQYLDGEQMTERDKKELGSKFWNKGKWDNFILPFLPDECKELSLVDMGCNAGLFLKLAQDKGFKRIIGVDSNKVAIERGRIWRSKNKANYQMYHLKMEDVIDKLPIVDYTILANTHYYFYVNDFIDYLDKLQHKTRYCIIVTDKKNHLNRCWASADINDIRRYFNNWEEVGFIDELPFDNDSSPRRLKALCFKSKFIDSVSIKSLDSSNHVQDQFYEELNKGIKYENTHYYKILKHYRKDWGLQKLNEWIEDKIKTYKEIKVDGMKKTILIDNKNRILDGNHRYAMIRTLGYKNVFIRKV